MCVMTLIPYVIRRIYTTGGSVHAILPLKYDSGALVEPPEDFGAGTADVFLYAIL